MAHWFASARFSIVHESHHSLRLVAFVKFSRMASEKLRLCECILLFFFLFKKFYFFLERRPSWQIAQANSPQMANGNRVGTEKRQGYRSFLSAKKKKKKKQIPESWRIKMKQIEMQKVKLLCFFSLSRLPFYQVSRGTSLPAYGTRLKKRGKSEPPTFGRC